MSQERSVLIVYNEPRAAVEGSWHESDAGVLAEVRAVAEALASLGMAHRKAAVRCLSDVVAAVSTGPERIVFNLVESLQGDPADINLVPAVCRALGRCCTGTESAGLQVAMDKWLTKAALAIHGVRTPGAAVVPPGTDLAGFGFPPPPLIVKPLMTDASEGIGASSVVRDAGESLLANLRAVHERFGQPALVEAYIEGREVNASLLQVGEDVRVLPLAEIEFVDFPPDKPRIVDYAAKWVSDSFEFKNTRRKVPAEFPAEVAEQIRTVARAAWRATGCRDYARVDMRVTDAGDVYVIEVNSNCDIAPDAGFAAALAAGGVTYEQFVAAMVGNAWTRFAATMGEPVGAPRSVEAGTGKLGIRWSEPADRDPLLALIMKTGFFRPDEMQIATEVLDESLDDGPAGHYQSYSAIVNGQVVGWVCFGPTPCTVSTYDIYWLVTDRDYQQRGIGRALMERAEKEIAARGGRVCVAETAGREQYTPTRRFYTRIGYAAEARLQDFYGPGDDKVVFTKRLG